MVQKGFLIMEIITQFILDLNTEGPPHFVLHESSPVFLTGYRCKSQRNYVEAV